MRILAGSVRLALLAGQALVIAAPAHASAAGWGTASTVGRDALVAVALGAPLVQGDGTGLKQAAFSLGSTQLVTIGLKDVIHEERPDRSDDKSFPSGHTSVSFASAATLEKRYGWKVGVPAHVVAAFVGVARVQARKHYAHDVLAGAAIGEAAGWLLTSKRNGNVQWLPWGDAHGGGLAATFRF